MRAMYNTMAIASNITLDNNNMPAQVTLQQIFLNSKSFVTVVPLSVSFQVDMISDTKTPNTTDSAITKVK